MMVLLEQTSPLTPEKFQELSGVSDDDIGRLEIYVGLLKKWQKNINLVSKDSLFDVWRRHVLDSAQLSSLIDPQTSEIVDIGAGAGFPGMVLAIINDTKDTKVHLIESNERKCAFLREVNLATKASVVIHNKRAEKVQGLSVDLVVSRAVASVEKLLQYADPLLKKKGQCLFLKGKKWKDELTQAKIKWIIKATVIQSVSDSSGKILKLEEISPSD
jgi:16S rRNA (guanine527-N7)-methyltransferase